MLSPELDYCVESVLLEWWAYERGYTGRPTGAHASSAYSLGKANRRDMSATELLRETSNPTKMRDVAACVDELSVDHQIAIGIHFRNCYARNKVWRSNRLNGRDEEVYDEAKVMLLPMFRRRGVEI